MTEAWGKASAGLTLAATLGKPTLAVAAAVILGESPPDASFLVCLECVQQALFDDSAHRADRRGAFDQVDCGTCGPDREEDVGVGVAAGGKLSPIGYGQHGYSSGYFGGVSASEVFHNHSVLSNGFWGQST